MLTGKCQKGGRWFAEDVDFSNVPLFIAPNGVVAMSSHLDVVDYDYAKQVRLVLGVSNGDSTRNVEIFDANGKLACTFTIERKGSCVTVKSDPARTDFEVQLPFAKEARSIEGGRRIEPVGSVVPGDPGGLIVCATVSALKVDWV